MVRPLQRTMDRRSQGKITETAEKNHQRQLPLFNRLLDTVRPYLDHVPVASLSKTRIRSLAKITGEKAAGLSAMVAAHALATRTGIPASTVFALNQTKATPDTHILGSRKPAELRKKVKSAIKNNIVPPTTLAAFDAAKPALAHSKPMRFHSRPWSRLTTLASLTPF